MRNEVTNNPRLSAKSLADKEKVGGIQPFLWYGFEQIRSIYPLTALQSLLLKTDTGDPGVPSRSAPAF